MSPVDRRVLTRLSPSDPPGRVSSLTVMVGLAAWNALITAFALATVGSSLPERNVIVVVPPLPPEPLLPRLPALHAVKASELVSAAASAATCHLFRSAIRTPTGHGRIVAAG